MNVLFVGHERILNGASRSMINLIDTLSDRCNFFVLLPFDDGPVVDALKQRGIPVFYVPFIRWVQVRDKKFRTKKLVWRAYWDHKNKKLAREAKSLVIENEIDIIHSNSMVIDFGYRLSAITGIPHIWHAREMREEDFNMSPLCSYPKFYKVISDKNNRIVCISKAVYEKYRRDVPETHLRVIYNGVGKENINSDKHYRKAGKLVCLQAGSIQKAKGQDITIKAILELNRRGYKDIELLLAGRGSITSLGFNESEIDGIKCLGQVHNLPELRKNVDVEIVASRAEAFGRVTVEAMMSGNPVIGSRSGGTIELIHDGMDGYLFEPGNYLELADRIQYLYSHRGEIELLGRNAYLSTKDFFEIHRCANEIYSEYQQILTGD